METDRAISNSNNSLSRWLSSLNGRLVLFFLIISVVPLLSVSILTFYQSQNALRREAFSKMVAVRNLKAAQVNDYFDNVNQDIQLLSQLAVVARSVATFNNALDVHSLQEIRDLGFLGNPDLLDTEQFTYYGTTHREYHALYREIIQIRDVADVLLISPDGNVIYSYAKKDDFATNLQTGPYNQTSLADLYRTLVEIGPVGEVRQTDYTRYPPAGAIPVSFAGTPIIGRDGVLGILVYELSIEQIAGIMEDYTGLGQTGEAYLVGADGLMRSNSRFAETSTVLEQSVDNGTAAKGLAGGTGYEVTESYRNVPVLSAYQSLQVGDDRWVLLAEIESTEAFAAANELRRWTWGIIVVTALFVSGGGFLISRRLSAPLVNLTNVATRIAAGQRHLRAPVTGPAEVRQLAVHFNSMTIQLQRLIDSLKQRIADQERFQVALRASEARYRGLFEYSPVGVWEEDFSEIKQQVDRLRAEGVEDFRAYFAQHPETVVRFIEMIRVIDLNMAAMEMFAVEGGRNFPQISDIVIPENAIAIFGEAVASFAEGETSFWTESPQKTLSGIPIHVYGNTVIMPGYEETWSRVIVSSINITERKKAEAERERLIGELEAKNAELERFAYTVSHDLKSPLVTVKGFLGFAKQDLSAANYERLRQDMHRIDDATDKMQGLLNDLLELSRVGRLVNPAEEIPVNELVDEALQLVAGHIQARGTTIVVEPDLPTVWGDRPRLVEVFQNLIDNAIKFIGDQALPRIEIGAEKSAGGTRFYVRDNGPGIDVRYQEKVFELFERLDPVVEGTGIGLALVKRIVEEHNGRIWIESDGSGHGSTFFFTLNTEALAQNQVGDTAK